ncbi:MAG: hypothetical protein Q8M99_11920 [Methylotenera sp.]|nr:hypothetical protein [Methylotenera sp.]
MKRLIKIGDALSQLCNVLFLDGHPNESLSGRAWRTQSVWALWIDLLLWFDENHCKVAHENDKDYARELLKK